MGTSLVSTCQQTFVGSTGDDKFEKLFCIAYLISYALLLCMCENALIQRALDGGGRMAAMLLLILLITSSPLW